MQQQARAAARARELWMVALVGADAAGAARASSHQASALRWGMVLGARKDGARRAAALGWCIWPRHPRSALVAPPATFPFHRMASRIYLQYPWDLLWSMRSVIGAERASNSLLRPATDAGHPVPLAPQSATLALELARGDTWALVAAIGSGGGARPHRLRSDLKLLYAPAGQSEGSLAVGDAAWVEEVRRRGDEAVGEDLMTAWGVRDEDGADLHIERPSPAFERNVMALCGSRLGEERLQATWERLRLVEAQLWQWRRERAALDARMRADAARQGCDFTMPEPWKDAEGDEDQWDDDEYDFAPVLSQSLLLPRIL
jgi:hypothetical protein